MDMAELEEVVMTGEMWWVTSSLLASAPLHR